jgi:hypothetical protein
MPNLSLRGLDEATLARLKSLARRRQVSVNSLIVETLQRQYAAGENEFHDLDALAGAWSKSEADAFDAAIAPLAEVEPALWAAEPRPGYRVKARARRTPRR